MINPRKTIPRAIAVCMVICTAIYLSMTSVLTLVQPYYMIDSSSPFTFAFEYVNMAWLKYIVSISAILSLAAR